MLTQRIYGLATADCLLLQPLVQMFGYKKGEVEGKNVNILMPQPFSTRHNTYLRNYTTTGKAKILESNREVGSQLTHGWMD